MRAINADTASAIRSRSRLRARAASRERGASSTSKEGERPLQKVVAPSVKREGLGPQRRAQRCCAPTRRSGKLAPGTHCTPLLRLLGRGKQQLITAWMATWFKPCAEAPMLSAFEGLRPPGALLGTIQPGYSATLPCLRSAFLPMSDRQQLEVRRCSQNPP